MNVIFSQSLFPVLWIFIIAFLAFCLFIWLEIKRNQKLLAARLVAVCIAVLSIACLALKPAQSIKKTSDIIVLTPGYSKTVLDSLQQTNSKHQLYAIKGVSNKEATLLENYRDLGNLKGNLSFVGLGIPEYMLEYVDTSSVAVYPSPVPEGFIAYDQKKIYTVNHTSQVQGIFNSHGKSYTLKLRASNASEDSVMVTGKKTHSFSLKFIPKNSGLYLYTLTATDSLGEIIHTENLPLQVEEEKPLSILFLCDYPSAEIRFLKNFLETRHHRLTLRYKISKDRYRTEFVNTPQKNIGRVNSVMLQNFDLLLSDASSLGSLSDNELQEMKKAMKLGLGIVTLIDSSNPSSKVKKFLNLSVTPIKSDSASLIVQNKKLKTPATSVSVSSERKLFNTLSESSSRAVSGYYQYGKGKSGFQLLSNTYSLLLSGEKETYAELWSPLLEQVSRKEVKKYDLIFTTQFPYYQDESIAFEIIAAAEKPIMRIDSVEVPLEEDALIKNVWHGKIWAGKIGWHEATIDQDSSRHNFFAAGNDQWKNLRINNQQRLLQKIATSGKKSEEQIAYREISPFIFFVLFIISAGFLWLAPKL
jgi:hypothetical protein